MRMLGVGVGALRRAMPAGTSADRVGPLARPDRQVLRMVVALVCVGAGMAFVPTSALATLWVSSSGTDTGFCSQANPCATLSRAISLAIPNDTIYVGAGRFSEHVTISPGITGLTLQGAGMRATVIDGGVGQSGRVFTIQAGSTAALFDMTITGGQAPDGGGVNNAGDLTMQRDDVTFNSAAATSPGVGGRGGGVYSSGTLSITDSKILSNQAGAAGGGVYASDSTLARDLIDANIVRNANGLGGGIFITRSHLNQDTITGNQVLDSVGHPAGSGGGVTGVGTLLRYDTIAGNTAASGGGMQTVGSGTLGSIFARNLGGNCDQPFGPANSDNLEDDGQNTCGFLYGQHGLVAVDPLLAPLADNGGPTETMAITSSSPAYDASSVCGDTDQRGVSQLQRGAKRCDMGAYQVSAPTTYVANPLGGSVTAYATGATGDAAPVLRLAGAATGLYRPTGVVVDANGNVFIANAASNAITEYPPEVTGNAIPTTTIVGALTKLSNPQDVAFDSAGHLFVTNSGSVTEYAAGASGNVAPVARISGSKALLSHPHGVVIDPDGNLRVTNGNGTINTYSAHANGNVPPTNQLTSGSANALANPQGLNFDAAGHLVVADAGARRVLTFGIGASGAAPPISVLTGGSPRLSAPIGLDLDLAGDLFVADPAANSVNEYSPATTGAATASTLITGADTRLVGPAFLSELPPPPAPRVLASANKRIARQRLLRDGLLLHLNASGSRAFRAEPITVSAVARVRNTVLADAKAIPLRPGTSTLLLVDTKRAARMLRRHHRTRIVVHITARGGFGAFRHRLTITSTG
jgi:streptogramin lyase